MNSGFGSGTLPSVGVNYGSDLDCVSDTQATMAETSGLHMLAQALVRRLTTPRGTLVDDGNYGFDLRQFLGDDLAPVDIASIQSGIESELAKDERVSASQSTVTLVGGVLNVVIGVTPSLGPTFSLVLVVSDVTVAMLSPTQ